MTKSQNLFKLRKWGNYSNTKTDCLDSIGRNRKNPKGCPDWPHDATWTRITSPPLRHTLSPRLAPRRHMDPNHLNTTPAPPVAPGYPTTPHGPESRQHHSSTPCRSDWPHDATWTRITSTPLQHPVSLRLAPRRHMDPHHVATTPAPDVAPTGPTTPHGPESCRHHTSTPGRV